MAEILEAILQLDINSFTAALQQAAQQVTAFAQAIQGSMGNSAQAFQQQVQQINQMVQATQRASATIRQTKAEESADIIAQEKATSDFIVKFHNERAQDEKTLAENNMRQAQATADFQKRIAAEKLTTEKQVAQETAAQYQATAEFQKKISAEAATADKKRAADKLALERQIAQETTLQYQAIESFQKRILVENAASAKDAANAVGVWGAAIARVGTSLATLGGYLAASALISLPFQLVAAAKAAVQTAVDVQALNAAFLGITGNAAAARRELEFVRGTATRLGLDFIQTANGFKNIEAAARGTKLEGEKIHKLFEQVAAAQRALGLTSDQASRGLLALEQMISKGVISAEELRKQLSQAIPGSVGIMARALGVGTEELSKMMKNADLLSEDVLPKFGNQLEKELGAGLIASTDQAAATFARFGNAVREISTSVGESILTILKPVVDVINKGYELYRKAQKDAEEQRNMGLGNDPLKPENLKRVAPDLQKQIDNMIKLLEVERETLRELNKPSTNPMTGGVLWDPKHLPDIAAQQALVQKLEIAYAALLKRRQEFVDAQGEGGFEQTELPFAKQLKGVREESEKLDIAMGKVAIQAKHLPSLFLAKGELEQARQHMRDLEQGLDKMAEKIAAAKASRTGNIPTELSEEFAKRDAEYRAARAEVTRLEELEEAKKQAEAEDEKRRNALKAKVRADAAERERLEEKMQLAIVAFEGGKTAKVIELMNQVLEHARAVGASRTTMEKFESVERMRAMQIEGQEIIDWHDEFVSGPNRKRAEMEQSLQEEISRLSAKGTKSRVDDFDAMFAKIRNTWEDRLGYEEDGEEQLVALEKAGAEARARIVQEEQDKLAKEVAKQWKDLSNTIENIFAGIFQDILRGSKNTFDSIRDGFLKLMAKLAADALTNAIIIPAIIQLVGGGGGGGGAGGLIGGGMSGNGIAGGSTISGGGDGGSDILGSAMSILSLGNSVSGALGGPSVGFNSGGMGSMFGGSLSGLAGMELGELGVSGAGYIGGEAGSLAGLAGVSLSSIISGIGVGIGAGFILNDINKMMGLNGLGGNVLAGAGAGAAAGSIILPGIGTAVGTIVGALGGLIAGLLQKPDKPPGFDIQQMQGGRVQYNDFVGLQITQDFKILDDFHQKLGTDYEDFIAAMDKGINEMFQQVLDQVGGATPEVQRALVEPLNNAFQSIADQIAQYPEIGGENFKEQIEVMMEDFAEIFAAEGGGAVGELLDAIKKIDPVVQAFNTIIDTLLQDINQLQQQQKALDKVLEGNVKTLQESLFSPAQVLLARKQEYMALLTQFDQGDESTKILLAPQIGQLATAILELSKSVLTPATSFGDLTGIRGAMQQVSEAGFTPQQTLNARQADLVALMAQFRAGNDAVRTQLTPQITQLAIQIMGLAGSVDELTDQLEEQRIELMKAFPSQMRGLTNALFSPAQNFLSGQQQLRELVAQFYAADAATQITLEPEIAALAQQILGLAANVEVLGQDPQLLRRTQQDLIAIVQGVQNTIAAQNHTQVSDAAMLRDTLQTTQNQVMAILREVEYVTAGSIANAGQQTIQALWATAGQITGMTYTMSNGMIYATYTTANGTINATYDAMGHLINTEHYVGGAMIGHIDNTSNTVAAWSNALYGLQAQLIGQVASVRDTAWYSYTQLQNALWAEIGLAQEQIRLLVNSLYHLETVDAVVAAALGVLGQMNTRLGNPLNIRMDENLMTQLQRDSIYVAQQAYNLQGRIGQTMIALLAKPAFGLGWDQGMQLGRDVTGGFQHGGFVPFNMNAVLHRGEQVIPEWENRGGGSNRNVMITVYGGNRDPGQIADLVIARIEQKSGRLQSSTIQTSRR